ncbi:MAG TPA: DUF6364 family protein [Thermoanaerobaculia bacterium]|nr:DUF6364 family protein [Thermoanaerobaculia bacterium]
MDVTLSIDDRTLARARQLALRRGVSLEEMIRNYLENLTASDPAQDAEELPEAQASETAKQAALQRLERGANRILELAGTGLWEGDLSEMRAQTIRAVALRNAGRRVDEAP